MVNKLLIRKAVTNAFRFLYFIFFCVPMAFFVMIVIEFVFFIKNGVRKNGTVAPKKSRKLFDESDIYL